MIHTPTSTVEECKLDSIVRAYTPPIRGLLLLLVTTMGMRKVRQKKKRNKRTIEHNGIFVK
jgi:hypothetical protein